MKVNFISLIILFAAIVAGCQEYKSANVVTKHNALDFQHKYSAKTDRVELTSFIDIREWEVDDTLLVCKNGSGNTFYYRFGLDGLSLVDSFGIKGRGHGELLSPHLLVSDKKYYVVDNNFRALYEVDKQSLAISKKSKLQLKEAVNWTQCLSYPYYAYVVYTPNDIVWKIANAETCDTVSCLHFADEDRQGRAMKHDFSFDVTGDKAVLVSRYMDRFIIVGLSTKYDILNEIIVEGDDVGKKSTTYFTDVACGDYVYVLSQRDKDKKQHSSIEVYDYQGNAVAMIDLDVYASLIALDKRQGKIYLLSVNQQGIHVLDMKNFPLK